MKFVRKQTATIIHLGQQSLTGSSNTPDLNVGHAIRDPIWSCSGWSLPCNYCYQQSGALLPHPFSLTCSSCEVIGGLLSVALVVGLRRPGVTWHPALWSPDFPPFRNSRMKTERRLSGQLRCGFYADYSLDSINMPKKTRCQVFDFGLRKSWVAR